MSERRTEVRTYRVDLICDECGGKMVPTGMVLDRYPPQYPHRCEKCRSPITMSDYYPMIVHEDVPK